MQVAAFCNQVISSFHFRAQIAKGQYPEIPDFIKAARQDVLQELTDKLRGIRSQILAHRTYLVAFITESYFFIFK